MDKIYYAYWLSCIKGIGSIKAGRLLEYFGSEEEVFNADIYDIMSVKGIGKRDAEEIVSSRDERKIICGYDSLQFKGIKFTYKGQENYPEKLRNIYSAPYALFYKGSLPDKNRPVIAIVGARNASHAGIVTAERLGRELAEQGIQIVSGLARGIDVSSHRGCLNIAGAGTFAVLGCGVDICYPAQNIEEYMLIQRNGGILSEFAPGTPALAGNFPMRNRIISGLSDGILVIEAREKSGSLITAQTGLEQGKDIFVVPGAIDNPSYEGGNELIKSGAALVTNVRDILDAMGIYVEASAASKKKKIEEMLETKEKIVYASLSLEPAHVSDIALRTGFDIPYTMKILIDLEVKKIVKMVGGNYFALSL